MVVAVAVAVLAVTGGPILLSSIVAVVPLVAVAGIAAVGAGEGVIKDGGWGGFGGGSSGGGGASDSW